MLKTLAIATAALALGATSAAAMELGTRHSSGGSIRGYYGGRMESSYEGVSAYGSATSSSSNRGNGGSYSSSSSQTRGFEAGARTYRGSERANFGGAEWNTFSESSTFSR